MTSYLTTKSKMKRLEITGDDSKVLGKSPTRFLNKSAENFTTKKFMTHNSAWTPVNHKPSNEQVRICSQQHYVRKIVFATHNRQSGKEMVD